jgi:hypothetical protein
MGRGQDIIAEVSHTACSIVQDPLTGPLFLSLSPSGAFLLLGPRIVILRLSLCLSSCFQSLVGESPSLISSCVRPGFDPLPTGKGVAEGDLELGLPLVTTTVPRALGNHLREGPNASGQVDLEREACILSWHNGGAKQIE